MSIESDARRIFSESRWFYYGTIKSFNKMYDPNEKVDKHNKLVLRQAPYFAQAPTFPRDAVNTLFGQQISALRTAGIPHHPGLVEASCLNDFYSSNPDKVFGNCGEMSLRALWYADQFDISWDAWILTMGGPTPDGYTANHAFCCIGDYAPFRNSMRFTDLKRIPIANNMPWVVDTWANCCCPLNEYSDKLWNKMAKWDDDGKKIVFSSYGYVMPTNFLGHVVQYGNSIQVLHHLKPRNQRQS